MLGLKEYAELNGALSNNFGGEISNEQVDAINEKLMANTQEVSITIENQGNSTIVVVVIPGAFNTKKMFELSKCKEINFTIISLLV